MIVPPEGPIGRLQRHPAHTTAPSVSREEVQPLNAAEAKALLQAARHVPNGARWSVGLALALGLRQGEALGLRWDAVDLDAGTLTVRRALQRQAGKGLVLVEPKSRAGRRTIEFPEALGDALRAHRVWQAEQRLAAGNVWEAGGYVFCQPNGRPIDARRDWLDWKALPEGGRCPGRPAARRSPHRGHPSAPARGAAARVAMHVLGHSQISLTLGTYSHVVPELAQDAADRMGDALWG